MTSSALLVRAQTSQTEYRVGSYCFERGIWMRLASEARQRRWHLWADRRTGGRVAPHIVWSLERHAECLLFP